MDEDIAGEENEDEEDHVVTEKDLALNPYLKDAGVVAGDTIGLPVKAEPPKALEPEQTIPQPQEASAPATEGTVVTE